MAFKSEVALRELRHESPLICIFKDLHVDNDLKMVYEYGCRSTKVF